MPTPIVTPSPTATASTWQIGTYNAVNDSWTLALDLNDRATWFVKSYDVPQPEKVVSRSGNPRTQGERITNTRYKNRYITLTLLLRSTTTLAAIDTAIHNLEAALSNTPFMLRFAEAQAAQYSYAIVKSWVHSIPQDSLQRLAKVKTGITLVLECEPGLLGDKLYLDNLVVNPGFEAPSGPGVQAFNDPLATINSYTLVAGSAPTVAANVMTIPAAAQVAFGSPAWGALNIWQIRFKWVTGLTANFFAHYTDNSNFLLVQVTGTSLSIDHRIGGVDHTIVSSAPTLTNGNFYWMVFTQFPTVAGTAPNVQATVYNDSAGTFGAVVTNGVVGPVATFDAVTALAGRPNISASGAALQVGGAFSAVHLVSLFGPGAWMFGPIGSPSSISSGAWEQNSANTYPNGPVTSYGAARIDLAPAGTVEGGWFLFAGGASPSGTSAIPIQAAGNVIGWSVASKQAGLSVGAICEILFNEYNTSGTFLRSGGNTTVKGTSWTQYSGTYTTGANCAYISPILHVSDSTPGASANGTVWFDNVQVYNQTTTGQTSMPYCELRFTQSPARLLVSGLVGDMPTPAQAATCAVIALGNGVSNSAMTVNILLGRRNTVSDPWPLAGNILLTSPNCPPTLDSSSYGGWYSQGATATANPSGNLDNYASAFSVLQGIYYAVTRFYSTSVNPTKTTYQIQANETTTGLGPGNAGIVATPSIQAIKASNTWTHGVVGPITLPPFNGGAVRDLTRISVQSGFSWNDAGAPVGTMRANCYAFLPVDASLINLVCGVAASMYTGPNSVFQWLYLDGIAILVTPNTLPPVPTLNIGNMTNFPTTLNGVAIPSAATAVGTVPTNPNNFVELSLASLADPYLTLDPQLKQNGATVNELVCVTADNGVLGAVMPVLCQLAYIPRYLDPR
ncbi:MAG TPA: hypothetical protein VFN11_03240 [Ktedonobacterales bacterium]|nr:hypothetical protein [Ktedonobacterales bacterium]